MSNRSRALFDNARKKYDLQFVYRDNGQIYNDTLELNSAEHLAMLVALDVLEKRGAIEPGGEACTDDMLVPYREPVFGSLDDLRSRWTDGLQDFLDDAQFSWTKALKQQT